MKKVFTALFILFITFYCNSFSQEETIYWHTDTHDAYGGSGESWWVADPALGDSGGYGDMWYQVLDTDPISLTGDNLQLKFYHRYWVEPLWPSGDYDGYDGMNIRVSTDNGVTWQVLTSIIPKYNSTSLYSFGDAYKEGAGIPGWAGELLQWTEVTGDLSAFSGQTVTIRFAFASDYNGSTGQPGTQDAGRFGWQIDNINVSGSSGTLFSNYGTTDNLTPHDLAAPPPPPPSGSAREIFISDITGVPGQDIILKADLDGNNIVALSNSEDHPTIVFFKPVESKMFWGNSNGIKKAGFDVNMNTIVDPETVLNEEASEVKIDLNCNKLYWLDGNGIQVADLNQPDNHTAFISGVKLTGYTIDEGNNKIYFIQDTEVKSVSLSNSADIKNLDNISGDNIGIDFDHYEQVIFYSDNGTHSVKKLQLSTNAVSNVKTGLPYIQNLTCDEKEKQLYVSLGDEGNTSIHKINYEGTEDIEIISSGNLHTAIGINILDSQVEPSQQASNVHFGNISGTHVNVGWTRGNGERCVVVMREGNELPNSPNHGAFYCDGGSVFGKGTQLYGNSPWFCVYNGTDNGIVVTDLLPNTSYTAAVYEYNGMNGFEFFNLNESANFGVTKTLTSVDENSSKLPGKFELFQNYPNPFNPSTIISYDLPVDSKVTLKVYDILGNVVSTLVDEAESAGSYEVNFYTNNNMNDKQLSSGIYFYKLEAGKYSATKKMMLVR